MSKNWQDIERANAKLFGTKMRRHWKYLKYVVRHKWFVLIACIKLKASLRLALLHDISKFRPSEWFDYAHTFYTSAGVSQYNESPGFKTAWLRHQHRNPHHWQYWLLHQDDGQDIPIEMPRRYAVEMLADWMGAGRAITGHWDYRDWYNKNKTKIVLHPNSRELVEKLMA
jgi:hypothetical protein